MELLLTIKGQQILVGTIHRENTAMIDVVIEEIERGVVIDGDHVPLDIEARGLLVVTVK